MRTEFLPVTHPDTWSADHPECTCDDAVDNGVPCKPHDFCTCGTEFDYVNWPLPGPWCKACSVGWCTAAAGMGLLLMAIAIRETYKPHPAEIRRRRIEQLEHWHAGRGVHHDDIDWERWPLHRGVVDR